MLATRIPMIVSSMVPIEVFFCYPGIGDIAYVAMDPRIRYVGARAG